MYFTDTQTSCMVFFNQVDFDDTFGPVSKFKVAGGAELTNILL